MEIVSTTVELIFTTMEVDSYHLGMFLLMEVNLLL